MNKYKFLFLKTLDVLTEIYSIHVFGWKPISFIIEEIILDNWLIMCHKL